MLVYKFDVFKELKKRYTNKELTAEFSGGAMNMLRSGQIVGARSLDTVCRLLKKQPGSILKWVPDEETEE